MAAFGRVVDYLAYDWKTGSAQRQDSCRAHSEKARDDGNIPLVAIAHTPWVALALTHLSI